MTPRWVLLDRDGTINVKAPEGEYVTEPDELELLPGAAGAIRRLNGAGLPVAVVTNQRGVALGRMSAQAVDAVHAALAGALAAEGAHVDAVLVCPHERGTCACRKPLPGLLEQAASELGLALADAVMIGDADSDVDAGRAAGTRTVQLTGGPSRADSTAPTLAAAVDALLGASAR